LVWAAENPNATTIDPGIGRVTARGSRQVYPTATTSYTLTVTGPNNATLTSSVTVSVSGGKSVPNPSAPIDLHVDLNGVYGFAGVRGAEPPPLKPGAEKYRIVRGPDDVRGNTTLGTDCKPLGVPQSFVTPYPFQVVQTPKLILMVFEYPNAIRFIPTDGRAHPVDPDPTWMGDSVAHWEGDTLVVVVTGMLDSTWFDRAGNFHSGDMKVVERWTPTGPGVMRYEAEITDPDTFTRPWKMSMNLYKHVGEDARLQQFKCVEFVEELMYGHLRKEPLK